MEAFYLIKPGEILLKQDNQREFIQKLIRQIKQRLDPIPCKIAEYPGRFFLSIDAQYSSLAEFVLSHCPGLNGFSLARHCGKTIDAILTAACATASDAIPSGVKTFKIETRRSDKSFPLGSYEMSAVAGEKILSEHPTLIVDVHDPELTITIEIRERAYVYGQTKKGPRGLPSGSSGKGLLLLSGGIDSPVAGYLMAKRGMSLEAIYFHAYPYTSREAQWKVERLAKRLTAWCGTLRLWVCPFTDIQVHIKKHAPEDSTTIMLRMAMMEAADTLAKKVKALALITGESLGQVASQTAQTMRTTQSPTDLPVFRPLVGVDKEDTIQHAKKIETFEISILPYEDCCVLFSPKHPLLRPDTHQQRVAYTGLALSGLIQNSLEQSEVFVYGYKDAMNELGQSFE